MISLETCKLLKQLIIKMKTAITVLLSLLALQINAQIKVEKGLSTTNHFQTHQLATTNGDVFIGRTMSLDSGMVAFMIRGANEITLDFKHVDSIVVLRSNDFYRIFRSDFSERTAFIPTAFALKQGAIEYHNEMLFVNTVNYGVRDNFTVGIGFFTMPRYQFYNVHLKLTQPIGQYVHVGLGSLWGNGFINVGYDEDGKYISRFFTPFGSVTLGSRQNFVSGTIGKAFYYEDDEGESPEWIYSLNGAIRPTRHLRLYVEVGNVLDEYSSRIFNAGFGIIGKKSILNLGVFFGEDVYGVFPSLSYSRRIKTT